LSEIGQTRLQAIVHGRVQGVNFRAFVVERAFSLGVTGWTRNKWDGTVEVVAEGDRPTLEKLLAALHQGPRMAIVTQVDVDWLPASGEFRSFQVRSTF
jgi:acylphosphatase